MEILEDEATMPEGWLENESEEIDDLEALNPKDWMTMRMERAVVLSPNNQKVTLRTSRLYAASDAYIIAWTRNNLSDTRRLVKVHLTPLLTHRSP
ncbi:hypothetical protein L6452_21348 [Arctium lappa]|uniref:Uncharacterized protein n=1 Tax=Arctium lappa TaxID=4217 RepID=A0ACB9BEE0_ARCLA|nr:hypothetical protein L6452_21348 [Arctium lappa]